MRRLLAVSALAALATSCAPTHPSLKQVEAAFGEPCATEPFGSDVKLVIFCLGPDMVPQDCEDDLHDCLGGLLGIMFEHDVEVAHTTVPPVKKKEEL